MKGRNGFLMVGFLVGAIGALVVFKVRKTAKSPESLSQKASKHLNELESRIRPCPEPA